MNKNLLIGVAFLLGGIAKMIEIAAEDMIDENIENDNND